MGPENSLPAVITRLATPWRNEKTIRKYTIRGLSSLGLVNQARSWYRVKTSEGTFNSSSHRNEFTIQCHPGASNKQAEGAQPKVEWDFSADILLANSWIHFLYNAITLTLFILVLKYSLENSLTTFIERQFAPTIPGQCFLIGHLILMPDIRASITTIAGVGLLAWLSTRRFLTLSLDSFYFLFLSRRDLDKYNELLLENRYRQRATANGSAQQNDRKLTFIHRFMSIRAGSCVNSFRSYRLKPHRRLEDLDHMQEWNSCSIMLTELAFLVYSTLILIPYLSFFLTNDTDYVRRYPGCDLELEQLIAKERSELAAEPLVYYSFHQRPHKQVATLIDAAINFLVYLGTHWIVANSIRFSLYLDYDLMRYWSYLHNRMKSFDAKLNEKLLACCERADQSYPLASMPISRLRARASQLELDICHDRGKAMSGDSAAFSGHHSGRSEQQDEAIEVQQIKEEFIDFFHEIAKLDSLFSDALTFFAILWLSLLSTYIYSIESSDKPASFDTIFLACLGLFLFLTISTTLVKLHRNCLRTHTLLCAVVAKTRTAEKLQLGVVIDLYLDRKTTFTVFRMLPVTGNSTLRLCSMSVSSYFIISNILKYK